MRVAEVLEFHTPVRATVLPAGATIPVEIKGTIRGRTVERNPRYDVVAEDGEVYANLSAEDVRKDVAA